MEKNKKGIWSLELGIRAFALLLLVTFSSCSISKQISKQANTILLKDTAISSGHIGISIYEPATNKYWYNYDATKYFIPSSNTKLFSLYAGMKYLGDSLVGLRYSNQGDSVAVYPTGDPTFLHPDYKQHPAYDFLKKEKEIFLTSDFLYKDFLGNGWAWNDFKDDYMAQHNSFPMYGNVATIKWFSNDSVKITPSFFHSTSIVADNLKTGFDVIKGFEDNHYVFVNGNEKNKAVPFRPDIITTENLLIDTLHFKISLNFSRDRDWRKNELKIIHSQPSDSLFKPMMHNSDNFFAEQTLLMASNEYLGFMNDEKIIDTILKYNLKDVPQRPKWVDGSGLSRYNLFTPKSFIYILNKMKNEFGLERMKNILPTGGEGTLTSYYKKDAGFIYAKTGTLSNNCALSGYLITHKGKLLIFSVLANNYITGATPVRKAVEQFLQQVREKY